MFNSKHSDSLLEAIRQGRALTAGEKLNLIYLLSIPSILAQLTSVVMFFIDQAMVGRISVEAAAACGLVETSMWLCGSMTSAASMGFSVQVAHFIGANDFRQARSVFRHALLCCLLFSMVIAAIGLAISGRLPYWLGGGADIAHDATTYFAVFMFAMPFFQLNGLSGAMLKCAGNMRIPSVVSVLTCVLDVCFNYVLIFQFHLGVLGIALGTAFAVVIGACIQAYYAIFRSPILGLFLRSPLGPKGRSFERSESGERAKESGSQDETLSNLTPHSTLHTPRGIRLGSLTPWRLDSFGSFNWSYLRNAVKISLPMACQSLLMSGAQIVSTMIVAPLGNFAIAANTFAITAESLCYMPGYGIGEAATTLVGQSIGARRRELCQSFARMSVYSGMVVMALMGVLMFVFAPELMGLMTPVAEIRDLGAQCLRIEAFAEPFFAASIVCYSAFVGAGDTLKPAIMSLCSMWFVRLSLAALLARDYGLRGVWTAMAIELTFRGVIFLVRMTRGNWMKNMKTAHA